MTQIVYKGTSDYRELSAEDLKKANVEGFRKTSFAKGEPVEVDDAVATALVDNESGMFEGEFEVYDENAKSAKAGNSDGDDETPALVDAEPGASGSTPDGSTGRGTSTAGASRSGVSSRST